MPVCVSDIDLNGLSKVTVTAQNSGALCEYRTVDAVLSFSASAQAFPLMQSDLEIGLGRTHMIGPALKAAGDRR